MTDDYMTGQWIKLHIAQAAPRDKLFALVALFHISRSATRI
jgi:hypothetical protein